MNVFDKAINTLKTEGRCTGRFEDKVGYCTMGAMLKAKGYMGLKPGEDLLDPEGNEFDDLKVEEFKILASVVRENYPDEGLGTDAFWTISAFNDDIAQSDDEVIAMLEKASVRWNERV